MMSRIRERGRAIRELFATAKWMEGFDLDAVRSGDAYRSARLALLGIRAHQTFERTDASMHEVEAALAEARASLRAWDGKRAVRNKTARLPLATCDL